MSKMKLSKNLMQMKFMQRGNEFDENEEDDDLETQIFKSHQESLQAAGSVDTSSLKPHEKFINQPSFAFVEQLRHGRHSYKGMNPEIEQLEEEKRREKEGSEPTCGTVDVGRAEMARVISKSKKERAVSNFDQKISPKKPKRNRKRKHVAAEILE